MKLDTNGIFMDALKKKKIDTDQKCAVVRYCLSTNPCIDFAVVTSIGSVDSVIEAISKAMDKYLNGLNLRYGDLVESYLNNGLVDYKIEYADRYSTREWHLFLRRKLLTLKFIDLPPITQFNTTKIQRRKHTINHFIELCVINAK